MVRNIGIAIIGLVLCVALAVAVHAAPAANEKPAMNETQHNTTNSQAVCPVSGEQVSKDSKITYTYKDTVYRFCCPSCMETFKKDPEKYIKQIEEQQKGKAK